jgi:hypothetical protein
MKDTLTTSSEEAAADPTNLKGKSSDNKPDGLAVSPWETIGDRDAAHDSVNGWIPGFEP